MPKKSYKNKNQKNSISNFSTTTSQVSIRIAIIQFPGTNCEYETKRAVERVGMEGEFFRWNEDYKKLDKFDGYIIPGGFSYEDRSRAGVIASLDSIMEVIKKEAEAGKPVLGICNGAQILMEAGLIPGVTRFVDNPPTTPPNPPYQGGACRLSGALAMNRRVKDGKVVGVYNNSWIRAKSEVKVFGSKMPIIKMPIAHGEGRFIFEKSLLNQLIKNRQIVFRYCDDKGKIIDKFPTNPNGSIYGIAGVSNVDGNVVALMPHPERVEGGLPVFVAMRDYIQEKKSRNWKLETGNKEIEKLEIESPESKYLKYKSALNSIEIFVELIITDNEAVTVENALRQIGYKDIKIKKWVHWEVGLDKIDKSLDKKVKEIILSNELLNTSKEIPHIKIGGGWFKFSSAQSLRKGVKPLARGLTPILVRYTDDFVGQSKLAGLKKMGVGEVGEIKKGVVWEINVDKKKVEKVLATNIFYNPFSQKCMKI